MSRPSAVQGGLLSLPTWLRRNLRMLYIGYVFATHGMAALAVRLHLFAPYAWLVYLFQRERMSEELGVQLRRALERLGPTFIKFGQMLSTRVDLLPLDVIRELKKLQDAVPPEPIEVVHGVLERAFKRPVGELFASFDPRPVAAASIAQVHFAVLHDGREVAVKVRRPQIERTIKADLEILRLLARLFDRHVPEYRRLRAPRVVEEFANTIRGELNLRAEGAHASRFAANFARVEGVRVPEVLWDYTHAEVLTTERIHGMPVDEKERLEAAGFSPLTICERAAVLFFHMVFVDGYFHADMHPGNIFIDEQGEIVLVDFGIVGRLDAATRRYLAEMLIAFLREDYRRAAEVHLEAGYVPPETDISAFEDALREVAIPIFNRPLAEISIAELLLVMFSVTERFHMETQPQLLLLQKTMVVIEGVARELADDVNIWMLARPLVTRWAAEHLGPRARLEQAARDGRKALEGWMRLPERLAAVQERGGAAWRSGEGAAGHPLAGGLVLFGGGICGGLFLAGGAPWLLAIALIAAGGGLWLGARTVE
ncbi:MAG: 2-polyprenylphenol 6-hydroxylase [Zetaproteobacteria bacterium]|nr:MAG: 2-polyprenylphenol 6-hydroxylase [Zetaproteobacteria bacterium]